MKNVTKLMMALIAIGLSACGTQNGTNGQQIVGYNQNGTPIYGNNYGVGGNACITSMNQPLSLSFTAQGIDAVQARFLAGNIPQFGTAAGQHGSVTLSGGMQQYPGSIQLQKQSVNGSINMTLNPQSRTASGMIQISPQALMNPVLGLSNIMYQNMGGYGGYNQYPQQQYGQPGMSSQLCVTSIGLDVVYVSSYGGYSQYPQYGQQMTTGSISQALVYLYLNNGQVVQAPVAL